MQTLGGLNMTNKTTIQIDSTLKKQSETIYNFNKIINEVAFNAKYPIMLGLSGKPKTPNQELPLSVVDLKMMDSQTIELWYSHEIFTSIKNNKPTKTQLKNVLGVILGGVVISQIPQNKRFNNSRKFSKDVKDALKAIDITLTTTPTTFKVGNSLLPLVEKFEKELTQIATLPLSVGYKYEPSTPKEKHFLFCSSNCEVNEIFKNGIQIPTKIIDANVDLSNIQTI